MCNLYTVRKSAAEVAAHFGISDPTQSNAPEEVYPGYPGMVVREQDGSRVLQSMAWGFPLRLRGMSPTAKPKPVNNIADLAKPMWKGTGRQAALAMSDPADAFRGGRRRQRFEDADMVQREGAAHIRMGRALAGQR